MIVNLQKLNYKVFQITMVFVMLAGIMISKADTPIKWKIVSKSTQIKEVNSVDPNLTSLKLKDLQLELKRTLRMEECDSLVIADVRKLSKGKAYRLYQYRKGNRVNGGEFLVQERGNNIKSVKGIWCTKFEDSKLSVLEPKRALQYAIAGTGVAGIDESEIKTHYSTQLSKPVMEYLAPGSGNNKAIVLCYTFIVREVDGIMAWKTYVNAETGDVHLSKPLVFDAKRDTIGQVKTIYNGIQDVVMSVDSSDSSLVYTLESRNLLGPLKPMSFKILDYKNNPTAQPYVRANAKNVTDSTNKFLVDSTIGEIYFNMQNCLRFYDSTFQLQSVDGKGMALKAIGHYGKNYANANWGQADTAMFYGDGDNRTFRALVSLDITGHELTHGVTAYSAGLIYSADAGALNESFSDIFGVAVDNFVNKEKFNWLIGDKVMLVAPSYIRNMATPSKGSPAQPEAYLGKNWIKKTPGCNAFNDYCGVHTNSGVQNKWFYLLVNGGDGKNEYGASYTIEGIGMTDGVKIAYENLTGYLLQDATYQDAEEGSKQAAIDLYGVGSKQYKAVVAAWCAVGLDTCSKKVVVPSSINNPLEDLITVSPNPSNGLFKVAISEGMQSLTYNVVNIVGQEVQSGNLNEGGTVDLRGKDAGTYILTLKSKEHQIKKKLVIQ